MSRAVWVREVFVANGLQTGPILEEFRRGVSLLPPTFIVDPDHGDRRILERL